MTLFIVSDGYYEGEGICFNMKELVIVGKMCNFIFSIKFFGNL